MPEALEKAEFQTIKPAGCFDGNLVFYKRTVHLSLQLLREPNPFKPGREASAAVHALRSSLPMHQSQEFEPHVTFEHSGSWSPMCLLCRTHQWQSPSCGSRPALSMLLFLDSRILAADRARREHAFQLRRGSVTKRLKKQRLPKQAAASFTSDNKTRPLFLAPSLGSRGQTAPVRSRGAPSEQKL